MSSNKEKNCKLIVAAAGSGKTEFVVDDSLKKTNRRVLVTTFTEANLEEISARFVKKNRAIPKNITVKTWFSFLIQHGVKPYQSDSYQKTIKGMNFVEGTSALYVKETEVERHYFDSANRIYSDKIAKFAIKCDVEQKGGVIKRLTEIFTDVYIDEVQDMAAHDLEFIKLLIDSGMNITLVGDPRQGTFATSSAKKNKKFAKSKILEFFEQEKKFPNLIVDQTTLTVNRRCNKEICDLSNKFFPDFTAVTSSNEMVTGHDGVFLVKPEHVSAYLEQFKSVQLRDSKKTSVCDGYSAMNFGGSKGLTFDRVLIYPTKPMLEWLQNNESELAPTSKSKFYVAVTRARFSVAIVCDYDKEKTIPNATKFVPSSKN